MKAFRQAALAAALSALFVAQAWAIGDGPVVKDHVSQSKAEAGDYTFDELFAHGQEQFSAKFNKYDGQGRPGATGGGAARIPGSAPAFIRTSAPESNSCAGCHNDPFPGGAGDIVANVFVLAQTLDPVVESVNGEFSNERNTLGMQGSGAIEMLAREMTATLQALRDDAKQQAQSGGHDVQAELVAKGVHFGHLIAHADGSVDTSAVEGINADLILRPFHQKGAVVSLREFTNNATNHHHGMESVERFGVEMTGTADFDQDGVEDELSVGDITAQTLYQAALAVPGQVLPDDIDALRAVFYGEREFENMGCTDCHTPSLKLSSRYFTEPNPYNPAGNLRPEDVDQLISFDLTSQGQRPRLEGTPDGGAVVRAYTDLKRHDLCDDELKHYCNEQVPQAGISTRQFLTRKLWDVGNSAPYGHRGDLTTLTEAIEAHGGEARASRDAFVNGSQQQRDEVVEFLKSLQMLPPGTESNVVDASMQSVDKAALWSVFQEEELTATKPGPSALCDGQEKRRGCGTVGKH
ncbi:MAG: hypothetical protein H7A20_12325 [Rhodanobacteraceae bacterium]|nr:hypothetical protein [Rhodanobacteraceae bacterium]